MVEVGLPRKHGEQKEPVPVSYAKTLRCRRCEREYPLKALSICEFCFGPLEVVYDYEAIRKNMTMRAIQSSSWNMWRYKALLPVGDNIVDIGSSVTPLVKAANLGKRLGLDELYIKNDCLNPTNSFKDRVVAVAISRALDFGFEVVACASTGNLANSVGAHAAKAGLKSYVFIPADLEQGKIIGTAIYGPTVVTVKGNYDEVNRLCSEIAENHSWGFVNINLRPYYSEGSKTLGYEVAEQLGWKAPAYAVVPVASGSMFTKIYKGLGELHRVGLIGPVRTRMFVAQAAGCSPVVQAYASGNGQIQPVKPNTIAKSIAIGNPADGLYALKTIKDSGGGASAVSDEEIVDGMKLLAETEGVFAETAGGTVIASLKRLVEAGEIKNDGPTVAYITGSGLKTQEAVLNALRTPTLVEPTFSSFEKALKTLQEVA
ncbi:MAG: threonine synthase [Chloroflexi bacterium]|nr:threonine synthase [Chloroflexota bacterium]